jgi:hypothetical protein
MKKGLASITCNNREPLIDTNDIDAALMASTLALTLLRSYSTLYLFQIKEFQHYTVGGADFFLFFGFSTGGNRQLM